MASRLNAAVIAGLPSRIGRPGYLLEPVTIGAVHLGVGNFFRAHQAAYLDAAMNLGARGWGVCGVSLRSAATRDALLPQDGLYALIERGQEGDRARVIGSLRELLVAKDDPAPVVARMAARETRWVSLTITEKGYGHAGGSQLDPDDAAIAHDLAHPRSPCSAVGLLHAAVLRRRDENAGPMTVLSCDNLSGNGDLLRTLLLDFDAAIGAGAAAWIEDHLGFPNTMVDRIVPHTTDRERALALQLLGVEDAWPVATESFTQWVIEDRFAAARPPLEEVGVQLVADVRPFEAMKLRLLNAAHSAIAWLGVPAGLETVDKAIAQPDVARFIEDLWRLEVIPGLPVEVRGAAPAYCAGLLARFANPALAHRTAQIAMDGSQKLPLRILTSIRSNLAQGLPHDRLALVIAAWLNYLRGADETGKSFEPSDPLRASLRAAADAADSGAAARMLFERVAIFGDLAGHAALVATVAQWLERLRRNGAIATLSAMRSA
jgi:fructuronate reductase